MARPARPRAEALAAREAAAIVRAETGLKSAKALSREIAARVVNELMSELETDPLDLTFAALERGDSPFHRLAYCPDIDTASEFIDRRAERVRARAGRYLSPAQQALERRAIMEEIKAVLASRYDRHLRAR